MPLSGARLVRPASQHLAEYEAALRRGWSPDNLRPAEIAAEQLAALERDPTAFLAGMEDLEARGGPVVLPDGSSVERLPSFQRWIWDEGFCGSIGFRWQPGTPALPPHVLGHVGYAVVPWRRREGHATRALRLLLAEIAPLGLPWIELTTDLANAPSIRVIEANGGRLVERFSKPAAYGGVPALRFRIEIARSPAGARPSGG